MKKLIIIAIALVTVQGIAQGQKKNVLTIKKELNVWTI